MSTYDGYGYDDEPRRYHTVRTRTRDRDEPDYVREEIYTERGKGSGPRGTELVYRGRNDSVEDIMRDFPPPGRRYSIHDDGATRRTRSVNPSRYGDYDDDDRYTDYGAGRRRDRDRRRRRDDRDYDSEYSNSPPPRERRKSGVGDMLEGLGLGGVAGAILGKDKAKSRAGSPSGRSTRSRSRARSRRGRSSDSSRSRDGARNDTSRKWAQAAQAAVVAGAIEAFRSRKEPGPWKGEKGKRVATAALASGGIDGLLDRNPDKHSKRHVIESVIGGLVANRIANGPRSKSRGPQNRDRGYSADSYSRSRSRSRSFDSRYRGRSQSRARSASRGRSPSQKGNNGVKGLVAGGALAAAGTALYERFRSKSRKRRSPSSSSADSYVPSRNRQRDRRRSPRSDTASTRRTDGPTDRGPDRGGDNNKEGGSGQEKGKATGNLSDSSSTTDMENQRKKMRTKELLTAGLATIATIHAAHGVYSSMEAHEKRHKLVAEGVLTPAEARKKQTKAWIQDAAAVGIAALGIKGAFSEWKEMQEMRKETHEIEKRKSQRRKRLLAKQREEENNRQERLMAIFEKNPQLAMGYQMTQPQGHGGAGFTNPIPSGGGADLSGNPYAPQR